MIRKADIKFRPGENKAGEGGYKLSPTMTEANGARAEINVNKVV